jgi:cytochrome c553
MRKKRSRYTHLTRASGIGVAGLLAIAAVACAETTASAPAPATAPAAAPAAAGPAKEIAWADMNKDQRLEYMKSVVAPRMKQVFVNFSPDRFGKMNCTTCHGDSATEGTFKMPNPKLPKLPSSPDGFKALAAERPAVMEFMKNEVKPKMAVLLGMPEYTPETKSGFGCMECHTMAQ